MILLAATINSNGQDSIPSGVLQSSNSTNNSLVLNPKTLGIGMGGLYTGSLFLLNEAWYKGYPKSEFHTFNDSKEWLQIDKMGHFWSTYSLSRGSSELWSLALGDRRKGALAGSLSAVGFMTTIELLDGFSSEWGWSWSDMATNVGGSGLYLFQELAWGEQRIRFKFGPGLIKYNDPVLQARADQLFGKSIPERILKDYNGLKFWFSGNIHSFFPATKLPKWLNLAVGYGAEGLFGGFDNRGFDANGNLIFDRRDVARKRHLYIAPDIDFSKIKTRKKWLKSIFFVMDGFKIVPFQIKIH